MTDPGSFRMKIILFTISLGAFMGSLDVTIVNISLPTIAESFGLSTGAVSWIVLVYLIVLTGFLLAFGRLADNRGYRKVFVAGFAIFTIGSFLCGIVPLILDSFMSLVVFRVVQAVGASMTGALAAGMVAIYLPPERRGKGLAFITVMASLGIAAGPFLGGILTQFLGWHWIFLVNVPVGILAVFLSLRYLPLDRDLRKDAVFDKSGAFMIFLALFFIIFAMNRGMEFGWSSPVILGSFTACIIFFTAFVFHERRHPDPLLNLSLFKNLNFSFANAGGFIVMLVFTGATFLFPFYLEIIRGFSTSVAGFVLIVPSVAMVAGGPIGGMISDKKGSRGICIVSAFIAGISFLMFAMLAEFAQIWYLLTALALMGLSTGMFIPANSSLIFFHTPKFETGTVSGVMMTVRDAGASVGVAVFETVFALAVYEQISASGADIKTVIQAGSGIIESGFTWAFIAGVLFCSVAVITSFYSMDVK
ncbi:MAG: MFS transporter [Methanomicrobiaceae archaeon]|nr:MFS transporter [Methanomicrobiaceae archaeon]